MATTIVCPMIEEILFLFPAAPTGVVIF